MMNPDYIGHLAGFCTTISFLPQVIRVWKTRSVEDISLGMYMLFVIGVLLWLIYALWIQAWPLVLPNMVTLVLAGAVLVFKIRHMDDAKS